MDAPDVADLTAAYARLDAAEGADDGGRLELLEGLHRALEREIDQSAPAGR